METIDYLNCVVTFWKDDAKIMRLETNFLCDLWGMLHAHLNNYQYYTKATIEWNNKIITVDASQPTPVFKNLY
jgi:hypothetical protein